MPDMFLVPPAPTPWSLMALLGGRGRGDGGGVRGENGERRDREMEEE